MPPIRTHERSYSFPGNEDGKKVSTVLPLQPMQTKSKAYVASHEDPERARAEQEEEDAAIERATRAFELEAAKARYLDERDLREFARGVFRREYRAHKLDKLRNQIGLGKRRRDWDGERERARSMSPIAVGMKPLESEEEASQGQSDDNGDAMETDDDESNKLKSAKQISAKSKIRYRQRSYDFSTPGTILQQRKMPGQDPEQDILKGSINLISIPHEIQRKLLRAMHTLCLTAAFNFTKKYRLPLTLNIPSPAPRMTRLTIQALTDAIIHAYNIRTIPPESVWEDIAFGFVGVFEAAKVLDDAALYFNLRLSDRRMCAVLLTGVDLLKALRDKEGVKEGEGVLREAERVIEAAKQKGLLEGTEREEDSDKEMVSEEEEGSDDEQDEEVVRDVTNKLGATTVVLVPEADKNEARQVGIRHVYPRIGSSKVDTNKEVIMFESDSDEDR